MLVMRDLSVVSTRYHDQCSAFSNNEVLFSMLFYVYILLEHAGGGRSLKPEQ